LWCLCHLKSPPSGKRSLRKRQMLRHFADRRASFSSAGTDGRPPAGVPRVVTTSPAGSGHGRR
jgi:hypothetical protein